MKDFEWDINAESICKKCSVVKASVTELPRRISRLYKSGQDPCYVHRFNLKISVNNNYSLKPVSVEESVQNSEVGETLSQKAMSRKRKNVEKSPAKKNYNKMLKALDEEECTL